MYARAVRQSSVSEHAEIFACVRIPYCHACPFVRLRTLHFRDSFAFRSGPRVAGPERPITALAASPSVAKSRDTITKNLQGRSRRLLMAVDETDVVQSNRVQSQFYSPDDQVLLQSMLTTLADLDFAYEQERERVSSSTNDASLRARMLQKLRDQHRERRETYIRHLTVLQERIMPQLTAPVSVAHWER